MEVVIRLKPEWYEKLVQNARCGSNVEACLKNAVYRPVREDEREYILECDERALAMVAALADVVCPEAIPAMLEAYGEARKAK